MSTTKAFVFPLDPAAASSTKQGVNPTELWAKTPQGEKPAPVATVRTFYDTPSGSGGVVALSSLGELYAKGNTKENAKRELVRKAVGAAVKQVKELEGVKEVGVDVAGDAHAAAVAAHLAQYKFTLKTSPNPSPFSTVKPAKDEKKLAFKPLEVSAEAKKAWETGVVYAESQNLARTLMELPANMITPTAFTERVKTEFASIPNVEILVRDEKWAEKKGMKHLLVPQIRGGDDGHIPGVEESYSALLHCASADMLSFWTALR
ncbi:hypothetical protein BDQ17DRAFT_1432083 [Cyathus striatus]|nr:hypothetical protein BDQ17DRAFT_1432083 [Cyathus striatus]